MAKMSESESERYLRSVINASPVAIITINEAGEIITFSREAENVFGYSEDEALGQNVSILMPNPHHSKHDAYMHRYLDTNEQHIIGRPRSVTAQRRCGEQFPAILHITEFIDGERTFVGFVEDVSTQKATEQHLAETQSQLQHAGRMGAMGEIATSIAHELNQPLTAAASLAGAVSLTLKKADFEQRDDVLAHLDDAVSEIRRASSIIRQMRDFLRNRKTEHHLQPVNDIVEEASRVALIGAETAGVDITHRLGDDVGMATVDRIQLQQVIINLMRNGVDAMEHTKEKHLTITTQRTDGMIEIRVSDTGAGVSDEMKPRLFEAFATTKEDGMGIGLSISKSIIDAHQGELFAIDNNPHGSSFIIRIPATHAIGATNGHQENSNDSRGGDHNNGDKHSGH